MSENWVIGRAGDLPWRLPDELRNFKQLTMGHHLILGRKTYESLPGPLPGREIVVVTRTRSYLAAGCQVVHRFQSALNLAEAAGESVVFVGGGAQIYGQALPLADRMYLTLVHASIEGDTTFPRYDENQWVETHTEYHPIDDRHTYAFTFRILARKGNAALNLS
jgi:dihydrofolate reductase